jgi:hypothetical protein
MCGAIPLLPQYTFMEWCLVKKHRDNFTLPYRTRKKNFRQTPTDVISFLHRRRIVVTTGQFWNWLHCILRNIFFSDNHRYPTIIKSLVSTETRVRCALLNVKNERTFKPSTMSNMAKASRYLPKNILYLLAFKEERPLKDLRWDVLRLLLVII